MSDTTSVAMPAEPTRKSILLLSSEEVRTFLLKPESYCSLDLPPYIRFDRLIGDVHNVLDGKTLSDLRRTNPRDYDDVNYTILTTRMGSMPGDLFNSFTRHCMSRWFIN